MGPIIPQTTPYLHLALQLSVEITNVKIYGGVVNTSVCWNSFSCMIYFYTLLAYFLFLTACGGLCNFSIYCFQGTATTTAPEETTILEATTPEVTTTTTSLATTSTKRGKHLITRQFDFT